MINFAEVMKKNETTPAQRSIINKTTIPLGAEFEHCGVLLRCVERPYIQYTQDACSGCYFANRHCPKSQCSRFGRTDEKNVWFVEVSKS